MSENETKKEDFKGSGVFGDLPKEKWEEISRALEKLTVAPRSIIFRQGDPGDCFYIITSGKVTPGRVPPRRTIKPVTGAPLKSTTCPPTPIQLQPKSGW